GMRARAPRDVGAGADRPGRRRALRARRGGRRTCADRVAPARRQGRPRAVKALVTGSEGGIGRAIRTRLESEGYEVASLDLTTGFDVSDPAAWEGVGAVDLACRNAGVLHGETHPRTLAVRQD